MLQHGSKCIHHVDDVSQITCIDMIDNIVVAGRLNGTISFYHIKSNKCRMKLVEFDRLGLSDGFSLLIDNSSNKSTITTIRISPCMKYIATGTIKGKVMIIDISKSCFNDGKISFRIVYSHELHNGLPVSALTWSVSSNKLFSGCNGGLVIEINCLDIPNFISSNIISQPLSFDISSIFGKKVTNIVCKTSMPIRQIECSISETKDLIEYVDLVIVSTGLQTFLFQLPSNDKYKSNFKELTFELDKTDDNSIHYKNNIPLTCCCFSNSIDRTLDVPIRANSIYIVRQSEENMFLHYYTINGDIQETFTLKVINNNNSNSNMNIDKINFRFLSNFNSPSYKHALIAIDTEGNLFLINLQLMNIQILEHYNKNVYSACVYEDLIVVMKEDSDNLFTTVDIVQCISPIALVRDIKIFSMSLHSKICDIQTKWREKRLKEKMKTDRKKKVLDLTIDCSDDDVYNYMLNLNNGIDTTRTMDKSKFGSFSYISSYMDNLDYEVLSKIESVDVNWGGDNDNYLDKNENNLHDNDSDLCQKKILELVRNFKNYEEDKLLSIELSRIGNEYPSPHSSLEIEKLNSEVIKLNYSINLCSFNNDQIVDRNNILIAAEDTILTTFLLLNNFENTDISWLPKLNDKLYEYDCSNIDIEYLCMDVKELCESSLLLLDSKRSNTLGTLDRMNYTPLIDSDKLKKYDDDKSINGSSPKKYCPTTASDELEDSTDLSFLKESGDWFDLWMDGGNRGSNPYLLIKDRILSKKARTNSVIDSKGIDPINSISLDSLEGIYCSNPAKETYEITLEAPHGIGLSLVLSFDRTLEVVGFTKDMRGSQSPAEACGLIKAGDFLIGMNGMKFSTLKLEEIAEMLKKMDKLEDKSVRLTFRYGGEGHIVKTGSSISTDSPFMGGSDNPLLNLDGMDVNLNSRFSDHSVNSPTVDDQINSTWVDSKGLSSSNENTLQFPLLNHPWVNQLTFEQLNELSFDEWLAQTLRASQAIGLGGGYTSKECELPTDSAAPPISTEMIQSNIASKHLYPVAAPITCFGHQSDHITQVREIANLAWELRAWYISANQSFYFCDDSYSRLIRTPADKGSYKHTYHMVWDSSLSEFITAPWDEGGGSWQQGTVQTVFDVESIEQFRENNKKLCDTYPLEPKGINFSNVKTSSKLFGTHNNDDENNIKVFNYLEKQGFLSRDEDHNDNNISTSESFDIPLRNYLNRGVIDDHCILLDGNRCVSSIHVNWMFDGIGPNNFMDILNNEGGCLDKLLLNNNTSFGKGGVFFDEDYVFKELMKAIDFEIDNVRNGKEYRNLHPDNLAMRIQLPPVNLTVTLLKAIHCFLEYSLDCDMQIMMLLNKWMQTFCPISVQKRSRFRSKYMNFLDAANYGFSSGVELREFIAVSTDLVTLVFLLNSCWRFVYVDTRGVDRGSIKLSIDGNSLHCKDITICNFNFLKLKIDSEPFDEIDNSDDKVKRYWDDSEATEFIEKYGAYVDIDIVSAACSAMQYRLGMDYVLSIAQTDEQMNKASSNFSYLMKSENLYSSQQFLARVIEYTAPDFNLFLTLITHHLGSVYQKDEDLAVDLSLSFFPYIRPWNVKRALFGDYSRNIAIVPVTTLIDSSRMEENRNPVQDNNKINDDHIDAIKTWHENARKKYHRYLTELLCKFPIDSNDDASPVLEEFVDLSVYLSQQDMKTAKAINEGDISGFKKSHKEAQLLRKLYVYNNNNNNNNNDDDEMKMMKDTNFYLCCLHFCKAAFFSDNGKLSTQRFLEKCKHLYVT